MGYKLTGVDTSKRVFTLHGVDASGAVTPRRELRRGQFEAFFARLSPCEVALEACGASHHWGRMLSAQGHTVRLIPPQYVKPCVKRSKTDRADAEAICEAASRPGMRFVPVRGAEAQAQLMVPRTRDALVSGRTRLINALRGHAAEFGLVVPLGRARVEEPLGQVAADAALPEPMRRMIAPLGAQVADPDRAITEIDAELARMHEASPMSRLLAEVPGIGPITAISLALSVEAERFEGGRHLAAWIGLTPREHSTGGRQSLGRISKAGHERLRQLLVLGATTVIRHARPGGRNASPWLLGLLARKPRKLAAVALANKMARIAWAMPSRGEAYRRPPR